MYISNVSLITLKSKHIFTIKNFMQNVMNLKKRLKTKRSSYLKSTISVFSIKPSILIYLSIHIELNNILIKTLFKINILL